MNDSMPPSYDLTSKTTPRSSITAGTSTTITIHSLITDAFVFLKDFLSQNIYEAATCANGILMCLFIRFMSSYLCFQISN